MTSTSKTSFPRRRIGIDARLMYQTGVGVYIRNLLKEIEDVPQVNFEMHVFVLASDAVRVREDFNHTTFIFHETRAAWHGFAEQVLFLFELIRLRLDLMHFPYVSWPVLYPGAFVATVHDTILLTQKTGKATTRHPLVYALKRRVFRWVFGQQITRAKRIMVPSYSVRDELVNHFSFARDKIHITHEGVDADFRSATPEPFAPLVNAQYLLYVGNCYPHKNVEVLLDAYKALSKEDNNIKLCIVGPKNRFTERVMQRVREHALEGAVVWIHDASPALLKWLYLHAQALVFPSKSEGFGLPILEAMMCGCPLILSDIPVFHEVAGDEALYFSPSDTNKLYACLKNTLHNKPGAAPYTRQILFDFAKMARETGEVYENALRQ